MSIVDFQLDANARGGGGEEGFLWTVRVDSHQHLTVYSREKQSKRLKAGLPSNYVLTVSRPVNYQVVHVRKVSSSGKERSVLKNTTKRIERKLKV